MSSRIRSRGVTSLERHAGRRSSAGGGSRATRRARTSTSARHRRGGCSSRPSPSRRRRRRARRRGRRPPAAAAADRGRTCRCVSQSGPTMSHDDSGAARGRDRLDAVERAVEHRPHQLGHAGVEDRRTACRPAACLTSTTRVSSTPAGPTMLRPGSRMSARARSPDDRQQRAPRSRRAIGTGEPS